jgi:benzoyl-CoA-dihydrodiol lyase
VTSPITFEANPASYRHWQLTFDGPVATVGMDVDEDGGLSRDYKLKLNSYDLSVDIELADAIQRIRFEHPEVHAVVIRSLKDRVFCAGANIFMLAQASHTLKVNFCKFTNETRLAMEDASTHSGIKFLAALKGTCAGGGYELALACDEILLVDDGTSAVSLPEVPLLGVMPGTGGLTRIVDKRKVRRDLADLFSTIAEGVRGRKAVEWKLVDQVHASSRFAQQVQRRAQGLAALSDRPTAGPGIVLTPLNPKITGDRIEYSTVCLTCDRERRVCELTIKGPSGPEPATPDEILAAGDRFWPLRVFRELDDALLQLRFNESDIGTVLIRTAGDIDSVLACDATLSEFRKHWLVRECIGHIRRTLKRLDLTSRTFFALIEPGSCFAGSLLELAWAADRAYMLDDPERPTAIAMSPLNAGMLPMGSGLSRLQVRFLDDPARAESLAKAGGRFDAREALEAGLISAAPDELDWDDEVRLAVEARASLSPDALTGMEANLRFAGPETLETKIFGRLTAWQNWIFQRPNAVGERGALKTYGSPLGKPQFDWTRT